MNRLSPEETCGFEEQCLETGKMWSTMITEDSIFLTQNANEDFIEYNSNRSKVLRLPYTKGTEKSIICVPKGTVRVIFNIKDRISLKEISEIFRDSLKEQGIDAHYDIDSNQGNDIVDSKGRKICGGSRTEREEVYVYSYLVFTKNASDLSKDIVFPEEYKSEKNIKKASDRFGFVNVDGDELAKSVLEKVNKIGFNLNLDEEKPKIEELNKYKVFE